MSKIASRRPVFAPAPDILAERGAQALHMGRFKDATDIFKQLIREDPRPEWTQRLGDAYAGRARALAEKDMIKEAAIVLENTLAADGTIREPLLYVSCLTRQGQHQKAQRAALSNVARLPAHDAARLADFAAAMSLAVPAPAVADANSPGGKTWAERSRAARAALEAWLQDSSPDDVDRLLGGIPLRSPFGPVRLILKSLITAPDGTAKARALLAMVPAESAFAAARGAAEAARADDQDLLDRWSNLQPAQQRFVAETRGLPRDATALLNQIVDAERRGPAALFTMLSRRGAALPEEELRAACLNVLPSVPERIPEFERRFGSLSALERNRIQALAAEVKEDWDSVPHYWHAVVKVLAGESTPEGRLAQAVVLRHMADLAIRHSDAWDDPEVPDKDPVAHYLERSLLADPDYLPATLALLERYRTDEDQKEWHRATEAAAQRFPGNVAVLLHAVNSAVARNAYKKAAGFARQVLTVDPINAPVRERMIELQLAHARKQMRAGRADLAGKMLAEAAEWERPDASSAALRIGRALVALTAVPDSATQDTLRAVVRDAGDGMLRWFHVALEASLMGLPPQRLQPFQQELEAAQRSEPDRATILALVSLLGQKEIRSSRKAVAPALRRIDSYLEKGSRIAWSPAEFQAIAELLAHLREFRTLHRYAHEALQRGPGDHTARFYQILARAEGKTDYLNDGQESELFAMLEQAVKRQDFHLVNRLQKLLMGPEGSRALRSGPRFASPSGALTEAEMAELMAEIGGAKPILPPHEVRAMVKELGRDLATEMLAASLDDSPMAGVLSDDQMVQLCAALIAQALENRPQSARRR